MDYRLINNDEITLVSQLLLDNYKYDDEFSSVCIFEEVKNKNLIIIGVFDLDLIGVIGIENLNVIKFICVKNKYRYQGIGTQLLNYIKNWSIETIKVIASSDQFEFFLKNGFSVEHNFNDIYDLKYINRFENTFQNYQQVQNFIASQKDRVYSLKNFKRFMDDILNPQLLLHCIHIGGTNGKGSTTNYVRSVLQSAGYKVASFTSPALKTRLEIIRINNVHISEDDIVRYANRFMHVWLEYQLSMFEIEVFIAIMYFVYNKVDFAVFEVGLGGELDATNIITPLISAITNIGMDHKEYLGSTYEEIAKTKAGIIKNNTAFVTGETKKECIDIFKDICKMNQCSFFQVQNITEIIDTPAYVNFHYRYYDVVLKTSARYQCKNASLAIEILLYLKNNDYASFNDETLLSGLKNTIWEGRFETIHQDPLIIIDGAHNKEGMEAFYHSAKKYDNIKIIFSALKDKDTHTMIELLLSLTKDVTVCEFDFYRAQSAELLAESFPVKIEKNWKKAIDDAYNHDGVIFITGSLYFISLVRTYIMEKE